MLTGHVEDYIVSEVTLRKEWQLTFGSDVDLIPLQTSLFDCLPSLLFGAIDLGRIDMVNTTFQRVCASG